MNLLKFLPVPLILGLIGFYLCSYVVEETDQVILTQFGKPVGEPVTEAGLHFKIPFVQEVNRIEKRFLPWDGPANEMSTKDKTYLIIDTFARWRINDPMQYFLRLRDERSALSRLNDILGQARIDRDRADNQGSSCQDRPSFGRGNWKSGYFVSYQNRSREGGATDL